MLSQVKHTRSLLHNYESLRTLWIASPTHFKDGKTDKHEWYSPVEVVKESWRMPKQKEELPTSEWRGVFQHFRPTPINRKTILLLQKGIDMRPQAIVNWYNNVREHYAIQDQSFNKDRVSTLGFDLGAAHFLVHRGGKVRFKNGSEWVEKNEDDEYDLSPHYLPGVFLEAVNASGIDLRYEGLESMKNLKHLKWLSVAGCPNIDDWCVDRLCGEYCNTLQHLDISNCTKITERGIGALARLRKLTSLNISGLDHIQDIHIICLLLEDSLPHINITGVNYMDPLLEK